MAQVAPGVVALAGSQEQQRGKELSGECRGGEGTHEPEQ